MDEKVLEEIRFHQDVVNKDANSPLYQIREKEMEIHGRVLGAKMQAESIVAEARQKAADLIAQAERDGDKLAKARAEKLMSDAGDAAERIKTQITTDTAELNGQLGARHEEAVAYVVSIVTSAWEAPGK